MGSHGVRSPYIVPARNDNTREGLEPRSQFIRWREGPPESLSQTFEAAVTALGTVNAMPQIHMGLLVLR